ncbi:permease [Alteromonas sp. a30]|uniref:permease n=1 Tax=Alteromonas sp. a30 TaxID=2730917 RepID=UPI0022823ABF|nr:permease [Alteromonas sp. a30]MCY7297282.1 permease [Alteromonas sp. a30]
MNLLANFWDLFTQSAPWLLLGYGIAGIINVYLPESWLRKQLGTASFGHSVKAAVVGAPLPLCSCGVIPTALGLRRRGASKNATASFMVATPETGVDSIAMTYALLGPLMAIARPIAAIFSAVLAGESVRAMVKEAPPKPAPEKASCCGGKSKIQQSTYQRIMQFSFVKLLGDTVNWLLIGLVFAAIIQTFVPESFLSQWGNSFITMLVMIIISIPMYICATASTPVAAGMLMAGVSPGAILVFMLTGPATNIATLGALSNELGKKAMFAYLFGVIAGAIVSGLALDALLSSGLFDMKVEVTLHSHDEGLFYTLSGLLLAYFMLRHYIKVLNEKRQALN